MNVRRFSRALLVLGSIGTVLLLSKTHAVVHEYDFSTSPRFGWSFALAALMALAAYSAGLPDAVRGRKSAVAAAVASTVLAALAFSVVQLLVGNDLLPRFVILGTGAVLAPVYVLCAALSADGRAHDAGRDRLLVVAGPDEVAELQDELDGQPERRAVIVGTLPACDAAATPGRRPLVELATASQATVVVLDRLAQQDDSVVAQAAALHEGGLRVRTLSLCFDQWLGKLPISELERVSLMFDIGEVHRTQYGRLKRVIDVAAGAAALVGLALVTPAVLAANRLGNKGPLFYRQPRVGKNGQRFEILKFRTMTDGPAPSTWTAQDDPRITSFGKWLRKSHLDELPQAVNILRGDLSIVGPRPEQPRYVDELTEKVPFYNLRHLVRPGLTGWAQVKYRYGANEADALEKLQYEFFYLRHQSLALDLRIIGRTLRSVIGRDGR